MRVPIFSVPVAAWWFFICHYSTVVSGWTPVVPSSLSLSRIHPPKSGIFFKSTSATRRGHGCNSKLPLSFTKQTVTLHSQSNSNEEEDEEIQRLMERAQQVRSEAERMERDLVTSKLQKLESLLERQSQLSKGEQQEIQDRIDQLKRTSNNTSTTSSSISSTTATQQQQVQTNTTTTTTEKDLRQIKEQLEQAEWDERMDIYDSLSEQERQQLREMNFVKDKLTEKDKQAIEEIQSIFLDFKDILTTTAAEVNSTATNNTAAADKEFWDEFASLEQDIIGSLAGNITQEELDVIKGAQKFIGMASWFFKFMGLNDTDMENLKKEFAQGMLQSSADDDSLEKGLENIIQIEETPAIIPPQWLNSEYGFNDTELDDFVKRVALPISDVFALDSINPKNLAIYSILPGTPKLSNGDDLIQRIDQQLVETGLNEKFQCYYFIDDSNIKDMDEVQMADALMGEDIEMEEPILASLMEDMFAKLGRPALLVTSSKVDSSPLTEPSQRALLSFLAVVFTASFAASCYNQDMDLMQQVTIGFTSPIFLGILGIQFIHELGHIAAAAINKIEIAFPFTMVPSPSTGLLTTNTQIKSPPKNNNALFDFAASGPLLGLAASWSMLLVGLQQTSGVRSDEVASLPHVPFEFFQLSTLTSSTIESFLGTDVLLSLDPVSDNVAVHPLVIAGHVGILINALNLVPNKVTTDGGRMLAALSTKSTGLIALGALLLSPLYLIVQGFRDWGTCNLIMAYWFVTSFFYHPIDIPCRNNFDKADGFRGPLFWLSLALAIIATSPSF